MYNYSFFLLSLLVANAVGLPWHDNVEQSQTLATYKFINEEGAQPDIPFCKSAVTTSTSTSLSTYVQVCRNDSFSEDSCEVGFCYFSTLFKCCDSGMKDAVIMYPRNDVYFGDAFVSTAILETEQGGCVTFLDKNSKIKICKTTQICFPATGCLTPKRVCQINTVEDTTCTSADGCTCKPGYAAPDCCKCDTENDFFNDTDGVCKKICQHQCLSPTLNDGCTVCRLKYQEPTCCDCKPGFVKNDAGQCGCPAGTVDVNGNCNPICSNNALKCSETSCTCESGYAPPDCCKCIFSDNAGYFKRNGQCDKICTEHANKENCNGISGCSQCENGFKPADCCKCQESKKLVDGICQDCYKDEEKIKGICIQVCRENIEQCNEDTCTCKPGYEPDDCCCPTGQKRDHNRNCVCKVTEKPPVKGVCPVPCIDHQDIIFLFDTSLGNDYSSLWSAAYFLEIVAAYLLQDTVDLNILVIPLANTEDQKKVENFVPKFVHPFDKSHCVSVALSIENSVYINLSPNTYSDLTLRLLNDLLVNKSRPTTIITLTGSPSNTENGNIENIVKSIRKSRSEIASGRALPVKYFAVNFINKKNVLKENFKKELIALAGDNEDRYVTGSNWMNVITNLLHTEGILCENQKNSVISYVENTGIFDRYLRCLRNKRKDPSHKCVELEEFSAFCTTPPKASIESKLVDALQELLGRLN